MQHAFGFGPQHRARFGGTAVEHEDAFAMRDHQAGIGAGQGKRFKIYPAGFARFDAAVFTGAHAYHAARASDPQRVFVPLEIVDVTTQPLRCADEGPGRRQ